MGPYTALQLLETAVFTAVSVYGIVALHPSVAFVGIGLLVGKAVMNILPRNHSVSLRSLVGYGIGLTLAAACVLLIRNIHA
ncbi:MAG: hypothetical protein M3010_07450 [Candidatus Dormibacteraeota bacterium]|nr:hypothetical protein [Candidatus Dormibacteraeota bacterium]